MSVIIRLQNLPWSANALDIRQFFKGLSIPEGGVHIVGGEMGDAFIAFSTDEDARQGMMRDREAINGVQVRLLLSSRAEMQKVIETARQQSLLALKNANLIPTAKATPPQVIVPKPTVQTPQPPVISASSFQNILGNPLTATPSFLAYQQQAGITLIPDPNTMVGVTKNNRNDSDESETRRERRRSDSRERRRSRTRSRERNGMFRRRRERSRERSRERDWQSGRRSSRRSRSREKSRARSRDRSRDRSRERSRSHRDSRDSSRRNSRDTTSRSRNTDVDIKTKTMAAASWNLTNTLQANYNSLDATSKSSNSQQTNKISGYDGNYNSLDSAPKNIGNNQFNKFAGQMAATDKLPNTLSSPVAAATVSVTAVATTFQNYNTTNPSLTSLNNYSLSSLLSASASNNSFKGFALQNPYTTALNANSNAGETSANASSTITTTTSTSAIPGIFVEKKSDAITGNAEAAVVNALPQEPIAFSTVNPYEQMYPKLFAQAAALASVQKPTVAKQSLLSLPDSSPKGGDYDEIKSREVDPNETSCVKISNMCSRTTYSDLRKFFVGLFIPHNGIKMLNDKHGLRVGIAYVQFSRQSSVSKALCRTNNLLKGKSVIIDAVAEEEFEEAEDSFRPNNQDKSHHGGRDNDSDQENNENSESSGYSALNPYKKIITTDPFSVLYIEDIPALATEQDIIKMFGCYSLYDILLLSSPENRREFVAHVRFSREEDAKSAFEDKAHHQIGYRRLRIRPGTIKDMDNAKEKIRLANEQLMKEELAAKKAAEEEETKRKLEELIKEQINLVEEKEKLEQDIVSMDLTQEDEVEEDNDDVVETTNELENVKDNENYGNEEGMEEEGMEEEIEEDIEEDHEYEEEGNGGNDNVGNDNGGNDNVGNDNVNNNVIEKLPSNDNLSYQANTNTNMDNNFNKDPRRLIPNSNNINNNRNIPSLLDLNPMNSNPNSAISGRTPAFNDPRLRNGNVRPGVGLISGPNNNNNINNSNNNMMMRGNNMNNFNPNFNNNQQQINPPVVNSIEGNFVILKNCEYNTRINDVAQLLITANLGLKHIEPLRNERQLPTGEFIVEFRRTQDAETAIHYFHNIQFRNRSLRVFPITPQEIADRLSKPFLGYIPGGNGIRVTNNKPNSLMNNTNMNPLMNNTNMNPLMNNPRFGLNNPQQQQPQRLGGIGNINNYRGGGGGVGGVDNIMPLNNLNRVGMGSMANNMKLSAMASNNISDDNNDVDDDENSGDDGIPEKFQRPGCVLSLENVPYKAQLSDILRFFQGYDLIADDIIRRFNDDGSPTGDARVAFKTPDLAKDAFEAKRRKQIFGRTIFLNIM